MMTASALAKRTNLPIYTVRHYTRIGLLKPSRDLRNGYRLYKTSDRERLNFISAAKELGFTLNEIEEILDHAVHGNSPCPMVREIVEKRVKENKEKIRELKQPSDANRKRDRDVEVDEKLRARRPFSLPADRIVRRRQRYRLT